MNIASEVKDFAIKHGLDFISTGGGYDFIYLNLGEENAPNFTIRNPYRDDSPYSLDEPASVFFGIDHEWETQDEYPFSSARAAITALASDNFRAAAVWEGLHLLDTDDYDVDEYIKTYHHFSESTISKIEALDLTYAQAAEFILTSYDTSRTDRGSGDIPA